LPQLQEIQGQTAAEQTAAAQRTRDIGAIYNQYGQQAQQAYDAVRASLNDIIAQNAPGPGQANLAAALQSAQGGQGQLAQMMGITAPPGQAATLPYVGAGQAAATATQEELNNLASSALTLPAQNLAGVGAERATELNTESLRHQAALQGLQGQQAALVQQIPGIIEKARQQMITDLQSAQSLRFQEQLAQRQFGLQAQAQQFQQKMAGKQFTETQLNDAANRAAQNAQIQQNAQALQNQMAATQTASQQALAQAQGKSQADAIKYLTSAMTPSKADYKTVTTRDPVTNSVTGHQQVLDVNKWHVDVGSLLRSAMGLYGLDQQTVLNMMIDIGGNTPISGQGGQTIADWASTFAQRQRLQQQLGGAVSKPVVTTSPGGGFKLQGTPSLGRF
jgi:hypothetical protein